MRKLTDFAVIKSNSGYKKVQYVLAICDKTPWKVDLDEFSVSYERYHAKCMRWKWEIAEVCVRHSKCLFTPSLHPFRVTQIPL